MTVKSLTNQEAQTRHESIKTRVRKLQKEYFGLAKDLYLFNKNKEYLALGYVSFRAYCCDPELDFSVSTAYMLMGIYEDLVLGLNIPKVRLLDSSPSKLDIIRHDITEENKDEVLAQTETLGRTDLRKWRNEKFGKPDPRNTFPDKIKLIKSILFDACPDATSNYQRRLCIEMNKIADEILKDCNNG